MKFTHFIKSVILNNFYIKFLCERFYLLFFQYKTYFLDHLKYFNKNVRKFLKSICYN